MAINTSVDTTSTVKFLAADFLRASESKSFFAGTISNSLKNTAKISHVVPLSHYTKK